MVRESKDALRAVLCKIFNADEIACIYDGEIPQGFLRPALYIHRILGAVSPVASGLQEQRLRWQVVYFPRVDAVGNPIQRDLTEAADRLDAGLGRAADLITADGQRLLVTDYSAEEHDGAVYASLMLTGHVQAVEPKAIPLGHAEVDIQIREE